MDVTTNYCILNHQAINLWKQNLTYHLTIHCLSLLLVFQYQEIKFDDWRPVSLNVAVTLSTEQWLSGINFVVMNFSLVVPEGTWTWLMPMLVMSSFTHATSNNSTRYSRCIMKLRFTGATSALVRVAAGGRDWRVACSLRRAHKSGWRL